MKKNTLVGLLLGIIVLCIAWYFYKENLKKWDFWPQREAIVSTAINL